jgi:hypothetical protein
MEKAKKNNANVGTYIGIGFWLIIIGFGIWNISEDRTKRASYENCKAAYLLGVSLAKVEERMANGMLYDQAKINQKEELDIKEKSESVCRV